LEIGAVFRVSLPLTTLEIIIIAVAHFVFLFILSWAFGSSIRRHFSFSSSFLSCVFTDFGIPGHLCEELSRLGLVVSNGQDETERKWGRFGIGCILDLPLWRLKEDGCVFGVGRRRRREVKSPGAKRRELS
jgi:hypothetical protein